MRIFFDAEVVDRGPAIPILPVSFGFVAEDGRELYVINEECLTTVVRDPWSSINIRPSLPIFDDQNSPGGFITRWDVDNGDYEYVYSLDRLVSLVHEFMTTDGLDHELWSFIGSHGHVALCQLFGSRAETPPGIPLFFYDMQCLARKRPDVTLPPDPEFSNHSLGLRISHRYSNRNHKP